MAFVDKIGVADGRIGPGDAGPEGTVAQMSLRNGPERVPVAHRVHSRGAKRCDGGGKNKLRANFDDIGIPQAWIDGEQFLPAAATAKALRSELPEGIAGLDGDHG